MMTILIFIYYTSDKHNLSEVNKVVLTQTYTSINVINLEIIKKKSLYFM